MPDGHPILGAPQIRAAEASPSAALRCAGAFARGLFTPSGWVVVIALALICLVFLWFCTLGSAPERIAATLPSDWMRNDRDDYRRITVIAHRGIDKHREPGRPLALFIGPSALRELLPGAEESERILRGVTGRDWSTLVLCADAMSIHGSAAVAAKVGADFDGWMLIGVNRHTLCRSTLNDPVMARRLGFESPYIAEALGGESRWLPLVLRRSGFFFGGAGGFHGLVSSHPDWTQHHFDGRTDGMAERLSTVIPLRVDAGQVDRQLEMLGRLVAELRARGGRARLALVEFPFLDEFYPELQDLAWRAERRAYEERMARWVRETGAEWWNLTPDLKFTPDDFCDSLHVRHAKPRSAYFRALAARLASGEASP